MPAPSTSHRACVGLLGISLLVGHLCRDLVDILRTNSCSLRVVVHLDVRVDLLFLLHLPARLPHQRFNGDTHRLPQWLKNFNNLVDGLQLRHLDGFLLNPRELLEVRVASSQCTSPV